VEPDRRLVLVLEDSAREPGCLLLVERNTRSLSVLEVPHHQVLLTALMVLVQHLARLLRLEAAAVDTKVLAAAVGLVVAVEVAGLVELGTRPLPLQAKATAEALEGTVGHLGCLAVVVEEQAQLEQHRTMAQQLLEVAVMEPHPQFPVLP
jgi:hypothetical protein